MFCSYHGCLNCLRCGGVSYKVFHKEEILPKEEKKEESVEAALDVEVAAE